MKFRDLLLACEDIPAVRDVSSPDQNLGVGSPLPSRREGLRSGSSTPYSGREGRTGFENSRKHGGTSPGSEEHLHKRGRRGSMAGTCLGRHPRRLTFDKELGPVKSFKGSDIRNQEEVPGITLRNKRKEMASPRKEPETKVCRGEKDVESFDVTKSTRVTRKGNTVAEPSTPPTGENICKKSMEHSVTKVMAETSIGKLQQCRIIEEPLKVGCGASVEFHSRNLGKRPKGRPRKSMALQVEQRISIVSGSKSAEGVPKKRGRPIKGQAGCGGSEPSDLVERCLTAAGVEKVERIIPSIPVETLEKSVEIQAGEPVLKPLLGGDVEDNMGKAVQGFTSPAANMSPKRPVGRPKKLPVVSLTPEVHLHADGAEAPTNVTPESMINSGKSVKGRSRKLQNLRIQECEDTISTIKLSDISCTAHVDGTDGTTNVTPERMTNSGKGPRGRPRKLQNLLIQECEVTFPAMKIIDTSFTANRPIPSAAPPSEAERANSEEFILEDPCRLFHKDAEEAYPGENSSKVQVSAGINDLEKASAWVTPDPAVNTSKRSRGRPRKVRTTQAGLKHGPDCADDIAETEMAVRVHTLSSTFNDTPCDEPLKFSVMKGSSVETATRDSVGPLEPVQCSTPPRNSLINESDAKSEEKMGKAFVKTPVATNEGKMQRPVGRPRKTGSDKQMSQLRSGSLKQGSGNAGRRPVSRPSNMLSEYNQDVSPAVSYSLEKTSKDEEVAPRQRPYALRKHVGHGKGSKECNEKAGRKRGRPSKGTKQRNGIERKRKGAVGRRRPADGQGQSAGAVKEKKVTPAQENSKRRYFTKVVLDGVEFRVGENVYVIKDGFTCSESEVDVEECQVCGKADERTMIECDKCLDGFHLTCVNPPLEEVPEDDWMCPFCISGSRPPVQLQNKRGKHRSAREMLLAAELWAARIEKMWSEQDGTYWFKARWFLIPEETATGRQMHSGSRELFLSSQSDVNEMDSILRHCFVMRPDEYKRSAHEGDDVFYCEYEYNERWSRFKRIDYDNHSITIEGSEDEAYNPSNESGEELDCEEEKSQQPKLGKKLKQLKIPKAANKRQSFSGGIEQLGAKNVVDRPKKGLQSDFEKAKAALTLSAVPPSMPCRDLERAEIAAFLKDSVGAGEECLGHCLYISGVPGTGKTATVREVIKYLESKVDAGELPAFRFVEINGLRLPSPDHVYTVLHEALTGQHLGWKKALECLDDRFSTSKHVKSSDSRPCVLLIDELDVLVNRNQSVLYNIFDWPSRPHSLLVVIGIANTMDLPERMLPRIASRMGMKRMSFSPYSHTQLEEIIASRLEGVRIFDRHAAEFASRKVAAVSGDIRRALELCRRAVEVAEARITEHKLSSSPESTESLGSQMPKVAQATPKLVTMADVDAAISQLFEAPQIQMMQRSSKLAKIFLTAMVCEQRRTSMGETTFEKVAGTCSELCANNGEDIPDFDTLLGVGCKLGALRILLCEPGARHKLQKIQLNFPCDDVCFALKDSGVPWLSKYL